jgi:hypothetical protein
MIPIIFAISREASKKDKILNSMGINDAIITGTIESEDDASSLDD